MNAYFQLMTGNAGTSIRLVPPTKGGADLHVAEMTEYLQLKMVEVLDIKALYYAISHMEGKETTVFLSPKPSLPEREMFSLKVSDDGMTATARFYPESSGGAAYKGKEEILDDLRHKKITSGFDEAAIEKYLKERNYCEDIVIARGKAPVHGQDARIEYYFNTDLNTKPQRNADGSVDFFHLNTINHCKEGEVLAKLFKEVPGEPGCNVYGESIKPRDLKRLQLKYGRNIELSGDGCEISSMVNGHVSLVEDKVFVSDVYEVENVGTATGNIESEGSVCVLGNVQTGFCVKAKGDVEIRGVVEGATVEAGGDIIVVRGMNGMGKGVLKAGGRVILKYAENARISSGSYVESESIMHSQVSARTEVRVDGRKGFIAGGVVRATQKITCKTLGSPMGADTQVEVGVDPEKKLEFQDLQKEIMEMQKNLQNIRPILLNLSQKLKKGERLSPEQVKYIQSLSATNAQLTEQIRVKQKEYEELEEMMKQQDAASVCVSEDAYPGTKISIGDVSMVLKTGAQYCRFVREKGDIRIAPL